MSTRAVVMLGVVLHTTACADRSTPAPLPIATSAINPRAGDAGRTRTTETRMDIAKKVEALAAEWEEHRQSVIFSSSIKDTLNHPAYRALIDLGEPAVPAIIEHYRRDDLPWGFVLQEITGVRMIDDPGSFRPDEVKRRWIEWWERKESGRSK